MDNFVESNNYLSQIENCITNGIHIGYFFKLELFEKMCKKLNLQFLILFIECVYIYLELWKNLTYIMINTY